MRKIPVSLTLAASVACAAAPAEPVPKSLPDPAPSFDLGGECFELHLTGVVPPDVTLPHLIELTRRPAPNFVEPGRFAVREPAARVPRAPISWWRPTGDSSLELVLGGGFTGYQFSLTRAGAAWVGKGTYFADFGLEPPPDELALRLAQQTCP